MTILTRVLLKEESSSTAKVLVALSLILVGQLFAKLLRKAADGRIPHDLVAPLVGLGAIKAIGQVLPLALLLGLMLTFGRMYQDSEMVAVRSAGVGAGRIYQPILMLALPTVALLAIITLYLAPASVQLAEQLIYTGQRRADISDVTQGRFIEPKHGGWVLFVENFSSREDVLKNVFVYKREPGKAIIETAKEANQYFDEVTGQQMLELRNGYRYVGTPGRRDYEIVSFKTHIMRIPQVEGLSAVNVRDGTPTSKLLTSSNPADQAELQWRLSLPIIALVMAVMALPLSHTAPRQGRFAKLFLAVVVYLIYVNVILLSVSFVETGRLPAWIGVWWVHIIMALVGLILTARQYGWWEGVKILGREDYR